MSLAAVHMDRMYRRQRHVYDATRKFYLLGRDRLIAELDAPDGGSVLEIGCGTARNLALAARARPGTRFYGVDVSEQMLATARRTIDALGLDERVCVAQGDAANFDPEPLFGERSFDRVFLSYALSMIPPWRSALGRAFELVAPGGSLHVVDFGEFDGLPRWFGAGMRAWLNAFSVAPRAELEAQMSMLAARHNMACRVERAYGGYSILAVAETPRP